MSCVRTVPRTAPNSTSCQAWMPARISLQIDHRTALLMPCGTGPSSSKSTVSENPVNAASCRTEFGEKACSWLMSQ